MKSVAVIGAGVGGLGAAIRLAKLGLNVTVFEKNENSGGKINNLQMGEYRFDMGPSVFTAPEYIKELYDLCEKDFLSFEYQKIEQPFNYFFQDGTQINIHADHTKLINELSEKLQESKSSLKKYLAKAEKNYLSITPLFVEKSLHRWKHMISRDLPNALFRIPKYKLSKTMHEENQDAFQNPKTHQIFNRFATYNGSDPYQAPAMLNMIQHLEFNDGVYFPKHGMVQIAHSLYELATSLGVVFKFNEQVEEIYIDKKMQPKPKVVGLRSIKNNYDFDYVFSNVDVEFTYRKLLSNFKSPEKILKQEKSSSALVFYWGINKEFKALSTHNMFFSDNYKAEFEAIFKSKTLFNDPTIYVHVSSKLNQQDAPKGKENWFVMINTPIIENQNWDEIKKQAKKLIIEKISKSLNINLKDLIEEEFVMDPKFIHERYNGLQGSIYGNASNNKFAAFYRHPNFSKTIDGLYFVGVTVHPGGGIPLALNSAKIAVQCLREDEKEFK